MSENTEEAYNAPIKAAASAGELDSEKNAGQSFSINHILQSSLI